MDAKEFSVIEQETRILIRDSAFDQAESLLLNSLAHGDPRFHDICRNSPQDEIRIAGWPELYADIAALEARGEKVSAIGLDLTGHNEDEDIVFECNYYDNNYFPFSTARRDEILAVCGYGAPWQGCMIDIQGPLILYGLRPLHTALRTYEHRSFWSGSSAPWPPGFASFRLATWFLYLRVHRAIRDALSAHGLPRPMPVVVGEHDFGPAFSSVYMVEKTCASDEAEEVLAHRLAETRAKAEKATEELAERFRERRKALQDWPSYREPERRQAYIDLIAAHETMMLKIADMTTDCPSWEMSDRDFEAFLHRFREARAAM